MKEKLIIHNFAGISDIELELGDINILIGPQATGKSICAKSLYYFKSFTSDIFSAVRNNKHIDEFNKMFIDKFNEYFPPQSWPASFSIRYEIKCESDQILFIQVKKQSKSTFNVRLTYSDYYKNLYETLYDDFSSLRKSSFLENQPRNVLYVKEYEINRLFQEKLKKEISPLGNRRQLFIPAGRSFFGILQSSIFTFLASNTTIDPFLKSFGSFLENIKHFGIDFYELSERYTKKNAQKKIIKEQVDQLIEAILKGKYVYEKDKDYLLYQDGRKTLLANASSGQQETLPLAIILRSFVTQRMYSWEAFTIYIEEPEAHIFPTAQKEIVQLISLVYNFYRDEPLQFVITTHSPYILTEFNNLLYAGIIEEKLTRKRKNKTELYKLVSKEQILNPNKIKCYSLDNGSYQSLISTDTGLITSDVIDAVSDEFSFQFGDLLDLDSKL